MLENRAVDVEYSRVMQAVSLLPQAKDSPVESDRVVEYLF